MAAVCYNSGTPAATGALAAAGALGMPPHALSGRRASRPGAAKVDSSPLPPLLLLLPLLQWGWR